jgi:glycosyltransferase involved in cell wall biosynthesis
MANNSTIAVLHVDSEKSWRGGQQQAAYLMESMHRLGLKTAMACKPEAVMADYCRNHALPFFGLPMHGELDFFAGYRIASLCRKHGYPILHLHSGHALATGLWAKLFYGKLRLIGVRRVSAAPNKHLLSWLKYKSRQVDRIVCISDAIKKGCAKNGIPETRLVTIHSGVDPGRFDQDCPPADFKKRIGIQEDHVLIGTVAAITKEKGYPTLLRAAKRVIERTDNVSFCAVGSGSDEKEIHALAEELGLGNRFVFTGFRKDVGNFLKSFDLFVLSSYLEGLGTSILDAQGVGLPVVACRTGGIPEVVQDRVNGLLVPPRDADSLATAILTLAEDESLRRELGRRAKETVATFAIDETVRKNIALYNQLLETQP